MGKPVIITLTVEASTLYGKPYPPEQSVVDGLCSLEDDNLENSPNNGPIEDFTSQVYIGNTVKWIGKTKDPNGVDRGYAVSVVSIEYEPEPSDPNDVSFFISPLYGTPINGRTSDASTTITNDSALDGKHDVYKINFRVYATGQNYRSYSIDPKLSGNPN